MTATKLPKLTELEIDVLDGCYRSEYTSGGNHFAIWSWSCAPRKAGIKQVAGVVSSLVKKGIVTCGGSGTKDDDNTIDVTPLGIEVARSLGFFTVQPNGEEWYNPDHADAFRPAATKKVVEAPSKKTQDIIDTIEFVSVRLGHGAVQVLQLDDKTVREDLGLLVDFSKKSFVTVKATRKDMRYLADCFQNRISNQYDQPLWYMSSAKASAAAIRKALVAK